MKHEETLPGRQWRVKAYKTGSRTLRSSIQPASRDEKSGNCLGHKLLSAWFGIQLTQTEYVAGCCTRGKRAAGECCSGNVKKVQDELQSARFQSCRDGHFLPYQ